MVGDRKAAAAAIFDTTEGPLESFLRNWRVFAIKELGNPADEPFLRGVCLPLEELSPEKLRELAEAMAEKMFQARGVGLAAPQLGIALRFFTVAIAKCMDHSSEAVLDGQDLYGSAEPPPSALFFRNPEILRVSKDLQINSESCLSVPDRYEKIARPLRAKFSFWGVDGARHTLQANGLLARCCLHENDHLDGRLFIDRLQADGLSRVSANK